MFHIVCTGSRSWGNYEQIEERLKALQKVHGRHLVVAHGASKGGGADLIVAEVCEDLKIDQHPWPVLPIDGNHRGAPLNRNKRMVLGMLPDLVVAFRADGKSNGTDFTVDFAQTMGYAVEMNYEDEL